MPNMRRHDSESACLRVGYEVLIHLWFLWSHPYPELKNLCQNHRVCVRFITMTGNTKAVFRTCNTRLENCLKNSTPTTSKNSFSAGGVVSNERGTTWAKKQSAHSELYFVFYFISISCLDVKTKNIEVILSEHLVQLPEETRKWSYDKGHFICKDVFPQNSFPLN